MKPDPLASAGIDSTDKWYIAALRGGSPTPLGDRPDDEPPSLDVRRATRTASKRDRW